jgi:deazaflavin-dependent oxidoreductase (nitroreductase family)
MTDQLPARRGPVQRLHWVKRWLYRGGRPHRLARLLNRIWAVQFAAGRLSPPNAMTLQVRGRRSGKEISFPIVVAEHQGGRYLVSMLGEDANWVLNVRAAGGRAVLLRGTHREVHLEEVPPAERAPILREYLRVAPGARPHLPVDRHAPLAEFEKIADRFPVFRILDQRP